MDLNCRRLDNKIGKPRSEEGNIEQTNEFNTLVTATRCIYKVVESTAAQSTRILLQPPFELHSAYLHFIQRQQVPLHCDTASRQRPNFPLLQCKHSLESHLLLDLRDRQPWVQALRTSPRAVQNSMTPIQTHTVIQRRLSLLLLLISAVRQPSVTLQQHCRAKVFLRIPPVRRAGGGAAGAENALVEAIELFAVFLGLQVFFSVWRGS
jgi:hypothetical protein